MSPISPWPWVAPDLPIMALHRSPLFLLKSGVQVYFCPHLSPMPRSYHFLSVCSQKSVLTHQVWAQETGADNSHNWTSGSVCRHPHHQPVRPPALLFLCGSSVLSWGPVWLASCDQWSDSENGTDFFSKLVLPPSKGSLLFLKLPSGAHGTSHLCKAGHDSSAPEDHLA